MAPYALRPGKDLVWQTASKARNDSLIHKRVREGYAGIGNPIGVLALESLSVRTNDRVQTSRSTMPASEI